MIIGIGCDICNINRIGKIFLQRGPAFIQKILTEKERPHCFHHSQPRYESMAARFAAKEAFYKALPLTIQPLSSWKAISVVKKKEGKPFVITHGTINDLFKKNNWKTHLSISHEKDFAQAFVIIESFNFSDHTP